MNQTISDMFLNFDTTNAEIIDSGGLVTGYDGGLLAERAQYLIDMLGDLGVDDLPSAEQLVDDFHGRLATALD